VDKIVTQIRPNIRITPFQDLLFMDIDESKMNLLNDILSSVNFGGYSSLRTNSLACVGLSTCPLAVAESEKLLNPLISELEKAGYGSIEGINIGISGCERHCSRNVRFDISLEGKTDGAYQLKLLFGEPEKNHLAMDLIDEGKKYLRRIPQENTVSVLRVIIANYCMNKTPEEKSISLFHQRIGMKNVIKLLKENEITKKLMNTTYELYTA
jgi:sulfite reductase (NADPH) hemoprotein beta-component